MQYGYRREIRYRRNPVPAKLRWGRKTLEDGRGFWSYEDRLVENIDGRMVDPRFGGLDMPVTAAEIDGDRR